MLRYLFESGSRSGRTKVCVIVVGLSLATGWSVLTAIRRDRLQSCLQVDASALEFRDILWGGRSYTRHVTLQNASPHTVVVERFLTSCGCIDVSPDSLELPPGATADVHVSVDLKDFMPTHFEETFIGSVVPVLQPPLESQAWRISGRTRTVFQLSESQLDFDFDYGHDTRHASKQLQIRNLSGRGQVFAYCDQSGVSVSLASSQEKQWDYILTATPPAGLPIGEHRFDVNLQILEMAEGQWAPSQDLPTTSVPVRLAVAPPVRVDPDTVLLGIGKVGEVLVETVTVGTTDGSVCKVVSTDVSGSTSLAVRRIASTGEDEPESMSFEISQILSDPGTCRSTVTFSVQAGEDRALYSVTVTVYSQCIGTMPADDGKPLEQKSTSIGRM